MPGKLCHWYVLVEVTFCVVSSVSTFTLLNKIEKFNNPGTSVAGDSNVHAISKQGTDSLSSSCSKGALHSTSVTIGLYSEYSLLY